MHISMHYNHSNNLTDKRTQQISDSEYHRPCHTYKHIDSGPAVWLDTV